MRQVFEVFNRQPDDANADTFNIQDREGLHFFHAADICGQDWKAGFLQSGPQLRNAVVKFVIAERHGGVLQTIHHLDHRLPEEFVTGHRAREHVAAVEEQIGIFTTDDGCELSNSARAVTRQNLAVHVVRVNEDETGRPLRERERG